MDRDRLWQLRDEGYARFQGALLPTVAPDKMIGVRTPALRLLAKEMMQSGEAEAFLQELPHRYFDENQLHAFILGSMKDFACCLPRVEAFLPYVDNWATCDQLSPKVHGKDKPLLLTALRRWMASNQPFTVRFAIGMLMRHFLDEDFKEEYLRQVAAVESGEYYVNMMVAWYFATALAKQYEAALPYLQHLVLPRWTHNKAIQKAIESRRLSDSQKNYLRRLKVLPPVVGKQGPMPAAGRGE